jgi:predicted  nucleic acid-binding Zn-ribbon protein
VSIKSEIEGYQNLIMDLTKLVKGNKYKDEIRSTKKRIKEIEDKITLLKAEQQTLNELQQDNSKDFTGYLK